MQDKMPLVSIGLPTYNRASSLRKAITSALGQSYKNIELIISDNASSDDTERICREYAVADSRVTYVRQPNNVGPTPNFLDVLKRSRGEYFMWLCDDDWLDEVYVEKCVELLNEDSGTVLVGGVPKNYRGEELHNVGRSTNIVHPGSAERMFAYYNTISDNGIYYGVWRSEVIRSIPLANTMGNDWHQLAAAAYCGKIRTVDEVYIHRSLDGSTVSYAAIAEQMGLPDFEMRFPYLSIAFNAAKDIYFRVPVFKRLHSLPRALLAARVFMFILFRYSVKSQLSVLYSKLKSAIAS